MNWVCCLDNLWLLVVVPLWSAGGIWLLHTNGGASRSDQTSDRMRKGHVITSGNIESPTPYSWGRPWTQAHICAPVATYVLDVHFTLKHTDMCAIPQQLTRAHIQTGRGKLNPQLVYFFSCGCAAYLAFSSFVFQFYEVRMSVACRYFESGNESSTFKAQLLAISGYRSIIPDSFWKPMILCQHCFST